MREKEGVEHSLRTLSVHLGALEVEKREGARAALRWIEGMEGERL